MKFENSTQEVTLEDAIKIHNSIGLNFIVEDGKDVTFEMENKKEPFAEGPNANYFNSTLL